LKSLDVDYLKIDGSFIKEIAGNPTDVTMVKTMNEIALSLGLETIAEYVESNEIFTILKEIGVDYVQDGRYINQFLLLNWSTKE
jgi:EAL domain-containing protein (putative c-di-GMP-specific phosphodiesterase class I)